MDKQQVLKKLRTILPLKYTYIEEKLFTAEFHWLCYYTLINKYFQGQNMWKKMKHIKHASLLRYSIEIN